jgi:hypothetical protein
VAESVGVAQRPSDKTDKGSPTAAAGASPDALRLVSANVEGSLERFSDPVLLGEGKVNLISLQAVRDRFGVRWDVRKDQVYSFVERVMERGLGDQGLSLRVSETDFFVVQPDLGRFAGQMACLRYLREILHHFLGSDELAVGGVMQVTKISDGRLEGKPVDPTKAEAAITAGEDTPPEPETAKAAPAEPDAQRTVNAWTPFVSNDGRQLRVSAKLEPVYELKNFSRIGFRMIRRVIVTRTGEELTPKEIATLSAADLLRVDMATITRGIDRLKSEGGGEQLSLIVPLSFTSLSSQRGRTELINPLKEAGGLVKLGVICEICDSDGVPPGALLTAASLVKPFALLVVGALNQPSPNVVTRLRDAGLQALSFECPPNLGEAEFIGWATAAIRAAKAGARSVLVYKVASPARGAALASMGATHMSLATG